MIFDRTEADISCAVALRKKIQAGQTLSETEKAAFERGACTVSMLNRIENEQAKLANELNSYAYPVAIVNKQWGYDDIFAYEDYIRILSNLDKLKQAFYIYPSTPQTPSYMYGYSEANDIEKILYDIEAMITSMTGSFRKCGTFQCGEENIND